MPSATAPKIATANTFATDATALLTPDATPAWRDGTALITKVVKGATVTTMPNPRVTIGTKKDIQYGDSASDSANRNNPTAAIAGPITSGRRAPKRSNNPPAQRDSAPMMMVNGRNAAPAAVAE